jgi:hypothetical protein
MQTSAAPENLISSPNPGEKSDQHISNMTEMKLQYPPKVQCIYYKIAAKLKAATCGRAPIPPNFAMRASSLHIAGDPSVQHRDTGAVERDHVGAKIWRELTESVAEAEELRRMGRGETQRVGERHIQ